MFLKLTAVSAVAAVAAAAGPQAPADFLGSEHRYVLATSDEFDSAALGGWDKKLGDWLGTAPGAFADGNADTINGKLWLTAKEQPGFKPGELDEGCECGLQEISTGIVVSVGAHTPHRPHGSQPSPPPPPPLSMPLALPPALALRLLCVPSASRPPFRSGRLAVVVTSRAACHTCG